jgi:hypothetical protein
MGDCAPELGPSQVGETQRVKIMKATILSLIAAWIVITGNVVSAQAAPVGSTPWWQEMDREGRAGRPG